MAISVDSCVVALLGRDDGARRQLRQALEELGAAVAFEGEPGNASDAGVLGVSPNVVIVNLEEGVDDDLDHLQAVFDAPDINVVFNDADVSRTLEGWDLARWARHLAAKVLGSEDTMPPLPDGAQLLVVPNAFIPTPGPVPTPAQLAPEQTMDDFLGEALGLADEVPTDGLPEVIETLAAVEDVTELSQWRVDEEVGALADVLDIDLSSLDDALDAADAPAPVRLASTPEAVESDSLDALLSSDLSDDIARALETELEDTGAAATAVMAAVPAADALDHAGGDVVVEFGWDFDEPADPPQSIGERGTPAVADASEAATVSVTPADSAGSRAEIPVEGIDVADDFSWDAPVAEIVTAEGAQADAGAPEATAFETAGWALDDSADAQPDENSLLDADVAALAAQLEAFEATESTAEPEAGLDFSGWGDEVAAPVADSTASQLEAAEPVDATTADADVKASSSSFGELSLAGMGDEVPVSVEPASVVKATFDFSGLDGLSLEPIESDDAEDVVSTGTVMLDLVERNVDMAEEDVEPALDVSPAIKPHDDIIDPLLLAMGLVEAPPGVESEQPVPAFDQSAPAQGGIAHVVVLGASIGGPDALRTFLGELPADIPVVFLLVQHLESGYFERLAQQLQKSSPLPVKVASAGAVALPGEVLVIPANERVTLEAGGRLVFAPHVSVPHYTPSIDDVLHDVADGFGCRATAIIFSGMAGDAVEGAVYLTGKGGEVWAQDASSCVVSSMVDGARARGVVEFTGSPRELAQRCITRFMR